MKNGLFDNVKDIDLYGTIYRITLKEGENGCINVYASPCTLPSAVFQIATVCEKQNSCSQFEFYEAQVYTDPVEIIIDCNFCQIVTRALEIYLASADLGYNPTSCNRSWFF